MKHQIGLLLTKNMHTLASTFGHNLAFVYQRDVSTTTIVAPPMEATSQKLGFRLLVGIAGCVIDKKDIPFGDVVISKGDSNSGGTR